MEREFWNAEEAMSRHDINALQIKKMRDQVAYLSHNSPYYQRLFEKANISSEDFRTLEDLQRLPFTDKYQVGDSQERNPPFGDILCVPERDIVKYFRTSGTTLEPRNFAYSAYDWWDLTVEMMVRLKYATGLRPDDRVFIAFPYSTFIALWTSHYACEKMGCMVIPGGGTSTKERLNLMRNMKVTALCATPTYAHHLAAVAQEEGIDRGEIPLRIIHTGGEPLAAVPGSRARIEAIWDAKAFDSYGCNEGGCVAGGECIAQDGLHVSEEVLIPEVIGENGEPVAPGGQGELILSNVASKTMPLLRFKTGDVVTYTDEPCACGRQTIRIKVIGRTDDMILIKGTNVFPSGVEEMVKRCVELSNHFMIVIDEIDGQYELILQVEPADRDRFNPDEEEKVRGKLLDLFRENLRLKPVVQLMEHGSLPRFEVKAKRLIDKRKSKSLAL